ncbi:hypothetical protein D3C86_2032630 [compost metagenome]
MGELHRMLWSVLIHECFVDLPAGNDCPHRDNAVGNLLGNVHQIRCHAKELSTRPLAHATERCDDFVEYQQDVVLVTNFTQALQISLWWRQYTSRT